jgi:hypothetical protein
LRLKGKPKYWTINYVKNLASAMRIFHFVMDRFSLEICGSFYEGIFGCFQI